MDYIAVGKIVASFGIKGEVKVNPLTDDLNRFDMRGPYFIGQDRIKVHIEKYRSSKSQLVIKFEEYNNINEILAFINSKLYVLKEDRAELDKGEYYIDDLIGLKVYSNQDFIGYVTDIIFTHANDVYLIESEDKAYMVPAVKDFIRDIDLDRQIMQVYLIEGMEYEI